MIFEAAEQAITKEIPFGAVLQKPVPETLFM